MVQVRSLPKIAVLFTCLAISSVFGLPSQARAEIVTQIPAPFVTETFNGETGALSQLDLGATGTFLPNFATVYDNFTLTTNRHITGFSWIGYYEVLGGPQLEFLTLSVYNDVGGEPGTAFASYNVGLANETAVPGFDGFYEYTASISPLTVTLGETYWFSVTGAVDFLDNGWGLAFSDIGDNLAYQDFQDDDSVPAAPRFTDSVDYAFSVTAVPEPSSFVAIAVLAGAGIMWRRRKTKQTVATAV